MAWLEQNEPELAGAIKGLPWVEDGIEESEREATQALVQLATFGQDAFTSIVSLDWTEDGLNSEEISIADRLAYISERHSELALQIASFPWLADNVDENEESVVTALSYATQNDPTLSKRIAAFQWLAEGVDALEALVVSALAYSTEHNSEMAHVVTSLPWMANGVDETEASIVRNLRLIAQSHPAEAPRIARMPFLERIDPADASAVESLGDLAYFRPDGFQRIMQHPTISAGITDDRAKIVATLYSIDKSSPQLLDTILDPEHVTLEERKIQLPLAGEVELVIIRLSPRAGRSMDLLEHAVQTVEEYMGTPFPTGYVALLFADSVLETFAGQNFGTHITILPRYDVDDNSHEAGSAGSIIAHEVAHYYWSGNANWIDEGAAELMAILSENARVESPLDPDNYPCSHAPNIAALERLNTSSSEGALSAFRCNYSLGERLFLDLHRSLGEDEFKRGFRSLFQASEVEGEDETNEGTSSGISELREAFGRATSTPVVTARWYEGTERFDRSRLDRGPVDPDLPSINGMFTLVGVALSYDNCLQNKRELSFSIREIPEHVTVCLKYTYDVDSPQTADLEIVVWFEDGFPLQRIIRTIEAEKEFIGAQWPAYIGPSEWNWWATGRYYVYVYNDGRKVGEAEFTVLR